MKYLIIILLIFAGITAFVLSQTGSSSGVKDNELSNCVLGGIDFVNGNGKSEATKQHKLAETKAMNIWALGRINFSLPPQFKLVERNQHMHLVELNTISLEGRTANELWDEAMNNARKEHVASGYKANSIKSYELGPNFMASVYWDRDARTNLSITEAQRAVEDHVVSLRFKGVIGKENNLLQAFKNMTGNYHPGGSMGFNIGHGSITDVPGIREASSAQFYYKAKNIELSINTHANNIDTGENPVKEISANKKYFEDEDLSIEVQKNVKKPFAGMKAYEARVLFKSSDAEPTMQFIWFFPGEVENSLKPEITIKLTGPAENIDDMIEAWNSVLTSLEFRKMPSQ